MIEKHIRILGITFLILFILVLLTESPAFKKARMPKEIEVSGEFKEENIGKIVLSRENQNLELRKINGLWIVTKDTLIKTADKEKINRLIENLGSLKGKVIGKSESEFPSYEVDDKKGTYVSLFDIGGKKLLEIIVGKNGPDYLTNFVRIPGKKEVILVEKSIKPHVSNLDIEAWRNRRITDFKPEDVERVEYIDKEQRFMFYREGDKWILDSPEINAVQSKIQNYIRVLSSIYSMNFIDSLNVKEYSSKDPFLSLNITLKNGEKQGFKVIEKLDENKYVVKREGDDFTLYTLAKNFVETSLKKDKDWFTYEGEKEEVKKIEEVKKQETKKKK
ncbi:MAG: DUF4340 domain-containing protein [candidate division WOR-3 bacterium]